MITTAHIRAAIDKRQATQKDIAAQLHISEQYLSDILSGRRGVSAFVAVRLERVLGISADKLMIDQVMAELRKAREAYQRVSMREQEPT